MFPLDHFDMLCGLFVLYAILHVMTMAANGPDNPETPDIQCGRRRETEVHSGRDAGDKRRPRVP